jgi:hypothetical protein
MEEDEVLNKHACQRDSPNEEKMKESSGLLKEYLIGDLQ